MTQAWPASAFGGKGSRLVKIAQVSLSAALLFSGMAAADNCKEISGTISPLEPVACSTNPLGCFKSTFSGDLTGTFQSALTGQPIPNPQEGTLSFTARTTIDVQAPNGTISTSDIGIGSSCGIIEGQYVCPFTKETLTIVSGERAYKQVYGYVDLTGFYMAGQPGVYRGQLCRGNGKGNNK